MNSIAEIDPSDPGLVQASALQNAYAVPNACHTNGVLHKWCAVQMQVSEQHWVS